MSRVKFTYSWICRLLPSAGDASVTIGYLIAIGDHAVVTVAFPLLEKSF